MPLLFPMAQIRRVQGLVGPFGSCLCHGRYAWGPYQHEKIILRGFGPGHWNEQSAQNPHIKGFGGTYYLYFVSHVNDDFGKENEMENHRWGQRIGVAVAQDPAGPWKVGEAPLIDYRKVKGAEGYMVNHSVCQRLDGSYLMIFKTRSNAPGFRDRMIQCMATAKNPDGPFIISEHPILTDKEAEDSFLWFQEGMYYAILDDQRELYTGDDGLALFTSKDGENWEPAQNPNVMEPILHWEMVHQVHSDIWKGPKFGLMKWAIPSCCSVPHN